MHISLFNNPSSVSYEQWLSDCELLPEWRRQKACSYRFLIDKVLCTKAFLLLKDGLREHYGISEEIEFEFLDNGKPILKGFPNIHFNLSHCKKGVLCVISDSPIACDIEEIQVNIDTELVNYIFTPLEAHTILASPEPCLEFTKHWTVKEAIYKLGHNGIVNTTIDLDKGYVYTIAQ